MGKNISGLSVLLAVSSSGATYIQFLEGNNNEASVSSFFIALARELDCSTPGWRSTHVLVLDNCTSHKTPLVRAVLLAEGFTVLFGAPASYLAMPVERVFALMKKRHYDADPTPSHPAVEAMRIKKLTNKQ